MAPNTTVRVPIFSSTSQWTFSQFVEPVEDHVKPSGTGFPLRANQQEAFAIGRDVELVEVAGVVVGKVQQLLPFTQHERRSSSARAR